MLSTLHYKKTTWDSWNISPFFKNWSKVITSKTRGVSSPLRKQFVCDKVKFQDWNCSNRWRCCLTDDYLSFWTIFCSPHLHWTLHINQLKLKIMTQQNDKESDPLIRDNCWINHYWSLWTDCRPFSHDVETRLVWSHNLATNTITSLCCSLRK